MKDNFSQLSAQYAHFRPKYPEELFAIINDLVKSKKNCWDCGTGNGQLASVISSTFQHVYATDISENQIKNAYQADNIYYSVQPAEKTNFNSDLFDLVIVGQAIHWFDFDLFYKEMRRTCRADALLIVTGYGLLRIDDVIDPIIQHYYKDIVGPYWDAERDYIDQLYQTIPFPFQEIETPTLSMQFQWSREQLIGYLGTWSAAKHYTDKIGVDPLTLIISELINVWPKDEIKTITFPVPLRVGQIDK